MAAILSSPSTPSSHRTFMSFDHTPTKSSPLAFPADSSPVLSPTPAAHDRRRSQYKNLAHTSPTLNRTRPSGRRVSAPPPRPELFASAEEGTGKRLLRDRFKARCLERALKEREHKIAGKRRASDWSSDGPDDMMDFDEEEDEDESMLNDTFFSRIMASAKRKQQHSYRVSYSHEVGSSFDPDMEDPEEWEHELKEDVLEEGPDDEFTEEELAAYAVERELLEGLTEEDIFSYSDIDDLSYLDEEESHDPSSKGKQRARESADVEMEM